MAPSVLKSQGSAPGADFQPDLGRQLVDGAQTAQAAKRTTRNRGRMRGGIVRGLYRPRRVGFRLVAARWVGTSRSCCWARRTSLKHVLVEHGTQTRPARGLQIRVRGRPPLDRRALVRSAKSGRSPCPEPQPPQCTPSLLVLYRTAISAMPRTGRPAQSRPRSGKPSQGQHEAGRAWAPRLRLVLRSAPPTARILGGVPEDRGR